jgi:hypothetical protein
VISRTRVCRLVTLGVLVCAAVGACLERSPEDPLGNEAPDLLGRQVWTLLLEEDSAHVWLVQSDTAFALHEEASSIPVGAALWSVLDSAPDSRGLQWSAAMDGRRLHWSLSSDGVIVGGGSGAALSYVGERGTLRFAGNGTLDWGGRTHVVRFDALGGLPIPETPAERPAPAPQVRRGRGIVSLRIDDCHAADSASLSTLRAFGLVAEFAVPTRLIGRPGFCSRALLQAIADAGDAVESHSRFHERSPASFADFFIETVGSWRDLRALGYDPHNFIEPGTWDHGAPYFNTPSKLQSPYGALLRRLYVSVEGYASNPSVAIPALGREGPTSMVLPGYSSAEVEALARDAAGRGRWIQFMWHSGDQPADSILAGLRTIAALRDSGLIDVMPFRAALTASAPLN